MDHADPAEAHARPSGQHCCDEMQSALVHLCDTHAHPFACPDMLLCYSPQFDEYGLILHDGGVSYLTLSYCPFCGAGLSASRRDAWFDTLEAMGIDDPLAEGADIPDAFKSARWWQSSKETP